MARLFSSPANFSAIERRAERIADPVQRLKYLRRATAPRPARRIRGAWIACLGASVAMLGLSSHAVNRPAPVLRSRVADPYRPPLPAPSVWPVEQTADHDLYSNGLRIENRLAVSNQPRSYHLIARDTGSPGPLRDQPAGIVFHTSESDQAPFEQAQKTALQRIGRELLIYVRNHRAYHFVIDRFGRVHRIVVESDSANHAGHSVWADSQWAYLDLNDSFLGIAFEAHTQSGEPAVTDAQLRSARALTEMLRAKYNLLAENCVVHGQVSVNPANARIGWHTDWVSGFPFGAIGLPDNYRIPNPSLYLFGFEYDPVYIEAAGATLRQSLTAADERVRHDAEARGVPASTYRRILQQRFRQELSAARQKNAGEEN